MRVVSVFPYFVNKTRPYLPSQQDLRKYSNVLFLLTSLSILAYLVFEKADHKPRINYAADLNPEICQLSSPDGITFAGEPVPLNNYYVLSRFNRELRLHQQWKTSTNTAIRRAAYWFPQIEPILKENNIPDDFKYVVLVESMLSNAVSPVGAAGFWQLMEVTGRNMGLTVNYEVDERYHPIKATEAACRYLKLAKKRLGSWTSAAASYNLGIGGMQKQMRRQGTRNYYYLNLNSETQRYLYKALAFKEIFEHPKKYGFHDNPSIWVKKHPVRKVMIDTTINDLKAFAIAQQTTYQELKRLNPWLLGRRLSIPDTNTIYAMTLPALPTDSVVAPTLQEQLRARQKQEDGVAEK